MALYRESPNSSLMMRSGSYRPPSPAQQIQYNPQNPWANQRTPPPGFGAASENAFVPPALGPMGGKQGYNPSGFGYIPQWQQPYYPNVYKDKSPFTTPTMAELNEHTRGVDRTIVRPISGSREGGDIVQDAWQEQYDRYMAGLEATEEGVRAQYSPTLEGLEDEIGDLRAAAAKLGIPFDEYMRKRAAIGGVIAGAEGMEGSVLPAITKIYDDSEAEMREVYDQINLNMGEEVTKKLVTKVTEFEATMGDIIRTDESAIDLLHERSSEYAKALAQAAYSGDMYNAQAAETKINAQLDFKIKETQEDLARQKKAMAAAIKAATDQWDASFEFGEPEFDDVLQKTFDEYFQANNVPEHERVAARQMFDDLMSDKSIGLNESTFRRGATEYFNRSVLNQLGLTDQWMEDQAGVTGSTALFELMGSTDIARSFVNGQTSQLSSALSGMGMTAPQIASFLRKGSQNADVLRGTTSPEFKHLRNMYTTRNSVSTNWENIVAKFGPSVDESQVARAPSGYTFPIVGGGKYNDSFGYKRSKAQQAAGKMSVHQGIDIMAPRGSQLVSPVNGTVVSMDYSNIGGNYIKIRDGNGQIHYMAHLNALSKNLQAGSTVKAGTFVGTVGNTGNARDTSPHLHYEVRRANGERMNPYPLLQSTKTKKAQTNYQGRSRNAR